MDRRQFMKAGGILLIGGSGIWAARGAAGNRDAHDHNEKGPTTRKWGMAVDLTKCDPECDVCTKTCRKENNVAFFGDERWDVHRIRKVFVKSENEVNAKEKPVMLLCNHCDHPPCAQVCPVQATYKRGDGIVIVDPHRCIGCRYCMTACPYNARFFNYKENPVRTNRARPKRMHGVAESCDFCVHRIDAGDKPACVDACPPRAMMFGDLNDPNSELSRFVSNFHVKRIREDFGCGPNVYYLGL